MCVFDALVQTFLLVNLHVIFYFANYALAKIYKN